MIKSSNNPPANQLKPPTAEPNEKLKFVSDLDGLLQFPADGEFVSLEPGHVFKMKMINKFPFDSRDTKYKDLPDGIRQIRKILKGNVDEPPEGFWINPTRDAAMKRVYFSSLGMYLIKRLPADQGFVSDTTFLTDLEYRDGYEKLGCYTYFDYAGNIVKIVDGTDGKVYRPTDGDAWEWAKLKSRTSAFSIMSLVHVAEAHVSWGNIPGSAMRMYLPCNHPVRRAFSVHFFKTAYTVTQAHHALFAEKGVLHRSLPMEYEGGLRKAFVELFKAFKFERFPDFLKDRGLDDCHFHVAATDGMDLYNIMTQYASNFLDDVYPNEDALQQDQHMKKTYEYMRQRIPSLPREYNLENMKTVWGEILFRVTGWHASIGNVSMYALNPAMINIRLKPLEKKTFVAFQEAAIGVSMIVAVTTVDCPRLYQDWRQIFENPDNPPYAYQRLRSALAEHEKVVDERNRARLYKNVDFHPKNTALSISS
jgi:hypothetical protein